MRLSRLTLPLLRWMNKTPYDCLGTAPMKYPTTPR